MDRGDIGGLVVLGLVVDVFFNYVYFFGVSSYS